ncbi:MAG: hypothetical protein MK189_03985, partial [Acidimicrobiales bacterium]|nr:hypothetical protein [Acidimicrobiales bacterium]
MRPPGPDHGCLWRRRGRRVERRAVDHFDDEYQRGDIDDGYPGNRVDALDDQGHRDDVDGLDDRDPRDSGDIEPRERVVLRWR